ncbi:MAG: thiamine phosphate synthase [Burkholderiaceae bacterium]|nr:thiamine phosphate synthase [Burkholderiaceae bacterium]
MQGLYLVTPNWDDTVKLLSVTEQALSAGVGILQYRHKDAGIDLRIEQATALQELCRRYRVPFIINDHIDLALQLDADGVHVGGTDTKVAQVRALLGAGKIIGASCYGDLQLARDAEAAGASYVAFGGFYPSLVKQYAVTTQPSIIDAALAQVALPHCVIGGMTPDNAAPLVARGAHMVAAITSVYQAVDPAGAVRAFNALFERQGNHAQAA